MEGKADTLMFFELEELLEGTVVCSTAHVVEKSTLIHCCTYIREEYTSPVLHMQWRRVLYFAAAHAAEKNALLCCYTWSGEECSTPMLHMQQRTVLFSDTCAAVDKSGLLHYMCSGADHCALH